MNSRQYLYDKKILKRCFRVIRYIPNFNQTIINDYKREMIIFLREKVGMTLSNVKFIYDNDCNQYMSVLVIPKFKSFSKFTGKVLKINEYDELEDVTKWAKNNLPALK